MLSPPERVVVLPIENATGDPALAPVLEALAEHARQSLAASGGLPVVDGERTAQALALVGLPDTPAGAVRDRALLRALPASDVLRSKLLSDASGYRIQTTLSHGSRKVHAESHPSAKLLDSALRYVSSVSSLRETKVPAATTSTLPATLPALAAYGRGIAERRAGRLEAAIAQFEQATRADPGYSAAWRKPRCSCRPA
jgi:hypothetical protein